MSNAAAAAFKTLVDARVAETKSRRSNRVANSGRFNLDDMNTVAPDELVAGDVFIHDGKAYLCNGAVRYDDLWFKVHARPWDGGQIVELPVYHASHVALLT